MLLAVGKKKRDYLPWDKISEVEVAKALLEDNIPVEVVTKSSRLTKEKIEKL
ncbi:MAG: hypothetical protein AAF738_06955 [Bacteroidota bacterium]